jgi:hypothetical protein
MMTTENISQEKIQEGKTWAELELKALAIERGVRFDSLAWTDSPPSKVWIVTIESGAGEHTMALPYTALEQCATDESARYQTRERLRGLVGDLARIERRGHLR